MEAPIYPPATAFEAPVEAPYELSVETVSLMELMSAPAAWAVVLKHAPAFKMMVRSPQITPYLTNFTVETFVPFGLVTPQVVAAIDQDLRALPRSEGPAQ